MTLVARLPTSGGGTSDQIRDRPGPAIPLRREQHHVAVGVVDHREERPERRLIWLAIRAIAEAGELGVHRLHRAALLEVEFEQLGIAARCAGWQVGAL